MLIALDRGHGKTFKGDVEINKYLDIKNIIDEKKYKYSCLYKLICISTHSGTSSSSGHYTACCLSDNNKYYYFSDKYVHEIDENKLFNEEPYLLFYEQIDNEDKNEIYEINKEIKTIQISENNYKDNTQDDKKEKKLNNISQSLKNNIPLSKQEELKTNYNISKKVQSLQKENLKFRKKMEHVNIEGQKSKEKTENYRNPLEVIEEKKDNEIKPKGLYNIGLNCYMNSLLQCLFYIKELRENFIKNQNEFTDDQPICKAFAEVMNELKNSDNDYVEPKRFKKLIGKDKNLFLGCKRFIY